MILVKPQLIVNQQTANETIRIWQQGDRRWLDFNDGLVQSEINLAQAELLTSPLNRAMLAGMIFEEPPKRVLLVGTGGGATARYFSHRFPDVKGEAVEISESVASMAINYFEFPEGKNWTLIHDDIRHYIHHCTHCYDLILIDIAIDKITPEWIIGHDFLSQCRTLLRPLGHVALNLLVNDSNEFMHYLAAIRREFSRQTVCLSIPNYRNSVILAFNNAPLYPTISPAHLAQLEQNWAIEFKVFYQQMLIDNPKNSGVF
jgi:spermidine synthase